MARSVRRPQLTPASVANDFVGYLKTNNLVSFLTIRLTGDRQIAQVEIVDCVSQLQVTVECAHHIENGTPARVAAATKTKAVKEVYHFVPFLNQLQKDHEVNINLCTSNRKT